jgi:hypothetical protein
MGDGKSSGNPAVIPDGNEASLRDPVANPNAFREFN